MRLFFFIFSKFRKLISQQGFLSFNVYLTIFLISLSLTSLILTESFSSGYKKEVYSNIRSFEGDFFIRNTNNSSLSRIDYDNLLSSLKQTKNTYYPYIERGGIVFLNQTSRIDSTINYTQREGVLISAVNDSCLFNMLSIKNYFLKDGLKFSKNDIIIGKSLANNLNKGINDSVTLIFFDNHNDLIFHHFNISNIYDIGIDQDKIKVYVHFDTFRSLLNGLDKPSVNSINNNLNYCDALLGKFLDNNVNDVDKLKVIINNNDFEVASWDVKYRQIISFLNQFDVPVQILMWILMFLSIYSLFSLLVNFLIQKQSNIHTLYFLGISKKYIKYLFLFINLYIVTISIAIGNLLSLILIYFQNKYKIIKFPSEEIFLIDFLPADIKIIYFIKYSLLFIFTTILASLIIFRKKNLYKLRYD